MTPRALLLAVLVLLPLGAAPQEDDPLEMVFPAAERDAAVPHPDRFLAHPLGQRAPTPEEIDRALRELAASSPRLHYRRIGESWQGRPLAVLFVGLPERLQRLEGLRQELARIEDPRGLGEGERRELVARLPALGYLGFSIHGNETSGADAALLLAYHLASGRDPETRAVLENTLLILEPLMNPDGRARAVADLRGLAGPDPSFDDQELARLGNWPYGRFNHYGFDLNRDWIYASQPETRARIALLDAWRPLLFVDAHEMFPQDSFLFSPPRAPVNLDFPPPQRAWVERFSAGIAADFDRRGFVYYSGEWNEGWYPGYSDAWGGLRGSANLLFEQARVADHGVLQANREILSYGEAIARQLAASWASLRVLAAEREALLAERIAQRQRELDGRTRLGRSLWFLPPNGHPSRTKALLRLLELQGLKVFRSERPIGLGGARDTLGRPAPATLPSGTLVIPGRQALAPLAAALLDPDPRLPEEALREERRRLLREGASTIYDVTAWALPHMLGLPFVVGEGELPAGLVPAHADDAPRPEPTDSRLGWLVPGPDDATLVLAARLLREGLRPRLALEPGALDGRDFPRGSLVLLVHDHRRQPAARLRERLVAALAGLPLEPRPLESGRGDGDLPDLGGQRFRLLVPPRVAILGHGARIQPNVFGFQWHYLDRELGLAPTVLAEPRLAATDLRRYNVIVLPDAQGDLAPEAEQALLAWVRAGGTLIASGASAARLARAGGPLASRPLGEALEDLAPFREALVREWEARRLALPPPERLWSPFAAEDEPALAEALPPPAAEELRRLRARDRLAQPFMPQGAFVAARCDGEHWLAFGCDGALPVLVRRDEPLLAAPAAEAPVRLGLIEPEVAAPPPGPWRAFGWSGIPPRSRARLRLAGLLWPEARERLLHSAWVLREPLGQGQVILFAGTPAFRGAALAMQRVFGNAVVLGPGLGASAPILP